jgi:hypothetical protein
MRKVFLALMMLGFCIHLDAQSSRPAVDLVPNGKGWGVERKASNGAGVTAKKAVATNGISYHGGPVMRANSVNVYFIWYGDWTNGPKASDSRTTVNLLSILFGPTRGIGGSSYFKINTTYSDTVGHPTGNISLLASTADNYSRGKKLSDHDIQSVVSSAISSRALPKDVNGLYFVLTASDVAELSGFCRQYCAWHAHSSMDGTDIKFAFVGNPDRCPPACETQLASPNSDSGADGMASIMAREASQTVTDPDLNAWYDSAGNEMGDKCAWRFGPITGVLGEQAYSQTFGTYNWLIQMLWENGRGGGCDKTLGGKFYSR